MKHFINKHSAAIEKILTISALCFILFTMLVPTLSAVITPVSAAEDYSDYLGTWQFDETLDIYSYLTEEFEVYTGFSFIANYEGTTFTCEKIMLEAFDSETQLLTFYNGNTSIIYYDTESGWQFSNIINVTHCNAELADVLDNFAIKVNDLPVGDGEKPVIGFNVTFVNVTNINSNSLIYLNYGADSKSWYSTTPTPSMWTYTYEGDGYAIYDSTEDMYYIELTFTTNGFIPYIEIYDDNGTYKHTVEVDGQSDKVVLKSGERVDMYLEYGFTAYPVKSYSIKLYLYEYNRDIAWKDGYDLGYKQGLQAGQNLGYDKGYADGKRDGLSENASGSLGENLLGQTLNAPMNALNQFIIYKTASGFPVTLGLVVGGCICLTLFIAFLKIFSGG